MKYFLTFLFISISTLVLGQNIIKGTIIDKATKQPLEMVLVTNLASQQWALSKADGTFEIKNVVNSDFTLFVKLLGKEERTISYKKNQLNTNLIIDLENKDLRLEEVIVTAQKGKNFSEITMGTEAINQVQAFSLNEVLEQIPGQSITDLNLNEFKPIAFRTVRPVNARDAAFGNKAFGVSVVVDGIPISNNENMQSYGANYNSVYSSSALDFGDGTSSFNGSFNNAGYGTDLRELPLDNIENIEVIQGIPSAKYGDLTSGLINVRKKAGRSKYRAYTSLRDGTTEFGLSKGFALSPTLGNLNVGVNYLSSNSEPRESYTQYNRVTTNLMWSWANKNKNIRNNFSVDYSFNKDDVNYEAEAKDNKKVKNNNKSFSFSNNFNWQFDNSFFDNLMVNANFKLINQYSFESRYVNVGGKVVGTSKEPGVYEGVYTLPSYLLVKEVEGKPISGFASVELNKSFGVGLFEHNLSLGSDFRISDNMGRGQLGEPENIPNFFGGNSGGGTGFRPYNYGRNVLAEYQIAAFAEDNIIRYWENSVLSMNLGARFDYQYGIANLSPRINAFYSFDKYKIRGGYGISTKSPSLSQIYTGIRYHDVVLADLRLPNYYSMGLVQTFIDRADNPDLKPSKAHKAEIGFDYEMNKNSIISITAFYNTLRDGITSENRPTQRAVADLDIQNNGTQKPTYSITGYNDYYYQQMFYVNKFNSTDKGLELMASFRRLPISGLSLNITGSYIKTDNKDKSDFYNFTKDVTKNEKYGLYERNPISYQQLQFSADLTYHIPKVGLVASIKSEHFLINDRTSSRVETPYAYLDSQLNKHIIPVADRNNTDLYGHIISKNSLVQARHLTKTYHNFHLRLTKDFLNGFKFSFYANNFLDLRPTQLVENSDGSYQVENYETFVKLSFGTRIEYSF